MTRDLAKNTKNSSRGAKPILLVRNSFCNLENFPSNVLEAVRRALTYRDEEVVQEKIGVLRSIKMAFKSKKYGSSGYLNKKLVEAGIDIDEHIRRLRGQLHGLEQREMACLLRADASFPTGLLSIVKEVLKQTNSPVFDIEDLREKPESFIRFKWKKEPPEARYYQQEMREMAEVKERGVFESCVGSGKTLVQAFITMDKRLPTLIIEPSVPLIDQTLNTFQNLFGKTNAQHVTTDDIKKGRKLKPIRLVTVQTLASLQEQNLLQDLIGDIGLLLMDEFHHAASKSYTALLEEMDHIYYRYGFTGTFLRNDSKTLDMWGVLSNRLYHYPAYKAIEDGFITPVEFQIHKLQGVEKMNYQKEYDANYCGSKALLSEILEIVKGISNDDQILILVDRKDKAGAIIHEYLNLHNIENTYISGDDKKAVIREAIEGFNEHTIRVLIGSTVIGEGVDVHSTKHLILATGGKSEIKITQAIGRGVRLHPGKDKAYAYDFLFQGTKFLERHLEERLSIYENQFAGMVKYA